MAEGSSENNSSASGDVNAKVKNKQLKYGLFVVGGFILAVYLLVNLTSPKDDSKSQVKSEDLTETVQRRPGDKDSFAILSKQVNDALGKTDAFEQTSKRMNEFLDKQDANEVSKLRSEVTGLQSLIEDQQSELNAIKREKVSEGGRNTFGTSSGGASRSASSGTGSDAIRARPSNGDEVFAPRGRVNPPLSPTGAPKSPPAVTEAPTTRKQNVINLFPVSESDETAAIEKEAQIRGNQVKAAKPEVYDTENYVPPNAYVKARLVVSVDAPIGESSAADPKAAQFIITGPAKHVQHNNRIEQTELEGCLVNGSAQGNLSSESVSIQLHAMTCPMGDGRVSVSKVEGYATHLGKNGIRGTVVSREGDLVTKSIIAGTLEGLGRTASQTSQSFGLGASGGSILGDRPDTQDILIGSAGSGIGNGAGVYSQYLLERARAYEPVVSLPTGIEVELVFISGTLVRPDQQ